MSCRVVLRCIVLCRVVSRGFALCCVVSCCVMLRAAVLCSVVFCCVLLRCIAWCCVVSFRAMFCCVVECKCTYADIESPYNDLDIHNDNFHHRVFDILHYVDMGWVNTGLNLQERYISVSVLNFWKTDLHE